MYKIKLLTVCVALTNAISLNEEKAANVKPIDIRDQKMMPVEPVSPKAAGAPKDDTMNLAQREKRESRRQERKNRKEIKKFPANAQKQLEDQLAANKAKEAPVEKPGAEESKAAPEKKVGAQ